MNSDVSLEDLRWLVGPRAAALFDELVDAGGSLVALTERLQRSCSPARAHLILEQLELRPRAVVKFPHAERMFFLARRLEQATDLRTARYKAERFPAGQSVADLCCGIGGDLLALAGRSPVTAVDHDEAALLLAEANVRALRESGHDVAACTFLATDVERFAVESFAAWHLDPDRRATGRRTTQLACHAPGREAIERLLGQCPQGAIKLAPATAVPPSWEEEAELEWIGRDRQCRQQVAWFGQLAQSPGRRRATVLGESVASFVGAAACRPPWTDRIGRYVHEPDAAVLAADLSGAWAESHGLAAIHPAVPYFTSDEPLDDPISQSFEVTDVLPFDRKRLRKLFHDRGVGRLEIKTRGIEDRPERVRHDLRLRGDGDGVLLLARLGRSVTAIVARRL